jgi:subtilisin family serine protease
MRTKNISTKLFRLLALVIVVAMALSTSGGVTRADSSVPFGKEKADVTPVSLDEVQNYYGSFGKAEGPLGVVLELEDLPAALVYAQAQNVGVQAATLTINQINVIQQKQVAVMDELQASGIQATELFRTQKVYNGIWLRVNASDLIKLASLPGVKAIHPIIPKTIENNTSVPLIGAPQVWGGLGNILGDGVKIAVIDTGIDYIHYNFGGDGIYAGQDFTSLNEPTNSFPTAKVVGGWDFVGDAYNADPTSASYDPIPAPDPDPMDCYGHGSHVAGTAAGYGETTDGKTFMEAGEDTYAALKNLTQAEYINKFRIGPGVAPKAELYSLRVFGCEGSTDVTDAAIEWAMDPNNDGDLSDHLDVINMSLGSSFGSAYDTSAVASDNAAKAGVIVVASAGNANDVYYITGSPSVSSYAISVASSVDAGAVFNGFEVITNTAASPLVPLGVYPSSAAVFGPQSFEQSGDLAYASPTNGCDPVSSTNANFPLTGVTGKIALIDRGTCSFDVKVKNAQLGGALGVLMVNSVAGFPITMGGSNAALDATITIPAVMTTNVIGTALKTDLLAGTVTVLLSTTFNNTVVLTDPTIVDTISSFTSRGPARAGTMLKPDITAPGDTIFSTKSGSRDQGALNSGTSMASPHVAGVMALLKEMHPTWTVSELKALAMNTATHDLWTSTAHTAKYTPTRIGAGRVDVANAALSAVIAFNTANPEQVSLSFGAQAVLGTQIFVKSVTVMNTGVADAEYNVAFSQYYQNNPGLTFALLNADGTTLSNPVTIPAGSTLELKVMVTADALALTRARDASISTANARERFSEGGGYVTLTPAVDATTIVPIEMPALRLPVHIAARPASNMRVAENRVPLPAAATGTFSLTPTGTPVDTVDDTSLVSIFELKGIDPNEAASSGINDEADLQYIGATSDYPFYTFATSAMYFGIATYGKWDTPTAVEFDVYVDINEDGTDDYVIFNANQGFFTGTTDDVMLTAYCNLATRLCNADFYTNGLSGTYNTNIFNNNVMVLPVGLTSIGLVDGVNTDFDFYVVSFSRDGSGAMDKSNIMSYDVANQSFNTVDTTLTGMPLWYDAPQYSPTFDITYDKAAIADNQSLGLLLLHHHNAENTAEILTFTYKTYLPVTYFP